VREQLVGRHRPAETVLTVVDHDRALGFERLKRLVDVRRRFLEGLGDPVPGDRRLLKQMGVHLRFERRKPKGNQRFVRDRHRNPTS
jgi:hypothetical protein